MTTEDDTIPDIAVLSRGAGLPSRPARTPIGRDERLGVPSVRRPLRPPSAGRRRRSRPAVAAPASTPHRVPLRRPPEPRRTRDGRALVHLRSPWWRAPCVGPAAGLTTSSLRHESSARACGGGPWPVFGSRW